MFETEGTKYHPLFEHLLFSGHGHTTMTFAEIEGIIGARLPPSARQRAEWWSNSPSGHSQAQAWMRANYRASHVDLVGEKVDFVLEDWPEGYSVVNWPRRDQDVANSGMGEGTQVGYEPSATGEISSNSEVQEHPLFGIWVEKVKLIPGYDYTKPAFESDAAS